MTAEGKQVKIFRSAAEVPLGFGPSAAAIGNFDGVHCGHREILAEVAAEARALGAQALAITFDPHPERFLRPEQAPGVLTPLAMTVILGVLLLARPVLNWTQRRKARAVEA